jgi:uncharacterized membrane protein
MASEKSVICEVTGKKIPLSEAQPIAILRPNLLQLIRKRYPKVSANGYISKDSLKKFREEYIQGVLETEKGEVSRLDKEVIKSMVDHESLVKRIDARFGKKTTFGERTADKVAEFGGSWKFIGIFASVLILWVVINTLILINRPVDPYPFLLLNIMLSCLAAIQAPVIMMSQNRKETKDRIRAENDYKINLKAELEIRTLHEKLDNLVQHQWQRLLEIQQMQVEIMEEMQSRKSSSKKK